MEIGKKEAVAAIIVSAVLFFCIGSVVSVDPEALLAVSKNSLIEVGQQQEEVDISGLVDIHDDSIFSALIENERQALKSDDKIARALRASFNKNFESEPSDQIKKGNSQIGEQLKESLRKPAVKPVPVIKKKQPNQRFVLVIKKNSKPKRVSVRKPAFKPPVTVSHSNSYLAAASGSDWSNRTLVWVAEHNIINKAMRALDNYGHIISEMSARYNLPIPVIASIIAIESGGDPYISSHTNDHGLMQLNWQTLLTYGMDRNDAYDPYQNIRGGCKTLRSNLDRFDGNYSFAVTAYNRGPGTVSKVLRSGGNPVTDYAERVLCAAGQLEKTINSPSYSQR